MEQINTEFRSYVISGAENKSTESNDSALEKLLSRQILIKNQLRNQIYEYLLKNGLF